MSDCLVCRAEFAGPGAFCSDECREGWARSRRKALAASTLRVGDRVRRAS